MEKEVLERGPVLDKKGRPVAERYGQVGRDGRFAHSALARSHGDHAGDVARRVGPGGLHGFGRRFGDVDGDGDLRITGAQQLFGLVFDFRRERIAGLGETERDGDPLFGCRDLVHETAGYDVPVRFGMDYSGEQSFDFLFHVFHACLSREAEAEGVPSGKRLFEYNVSSTKIVLILAKKRTAPDDLSYNDIFYLIFGGISLSLHVVGERGSAPRKFGISKIERI